MVSENNCSHGREHSRTKTCLRQKVALKEYNKRTVYQGGHVWGQSKCDYPTLKIGIVKKQTMDGNQNRQFSLMHQKHIESSSNVPTRRTVPLAVDTDVIVLRLHAPHSAHVFV